jgi:PIN domain nuclease of toxin-antitoxin system
MYLLETHTLIGFLEGNPNIPDSIQLLSRQPQNHILVSIASFWEMAIKISIGKLALPESLADTITKARQLGLKVISVDTSHILQVETLPLHHRDPFDRLIIAQAMVEH